jgi:hypothetical protein
VLLYIPALQKGHDIKMTFVKNLITFSFFTFTSFHALAAAAPNDTPVLNTSVPVEELWINAGFYSYHFDTERNQNNNNLGLGLEYRYSPDSSITAGRFNNSNRQNSTYAGWYWQPISIGSIRLGGLVGVINGYQQANNGDWSPIILPVVSYTYKRIGINLTLIPTYKDDVYGSLTLQLKFKVF